MSRMRMTDAPLDGIHRSSACTYRDEPDAGSLSVQLDGMVGPMHRLLRPLARGGTSRVCLAEHVSTGQYVAAKLQDPRAQSHGPGLLAREAALLSRVTHPNIVRHIDVGLLRDGTEYLLLEYVSGIDLADWLAHMGGMPWTKIITVLRQLAAAVDHLHALGIVHSDIKPANVMLDATARDHVKLLDFGVAFDFHTEQKQRGSSGTPGYMAPEQLRGEGCGPAADRYAVAALASELLAGNGRNASHVEPARLTFTPSGRRALASVFERALHDNPERRYATATSFVDALERALCSSVAQHTTTSLKQPRSIRTQRSYGAAQR